MSADEDTELRDLVAQALESNGVLGKIKAQLRASVFLALEEQESVHTKAPFQNAAFKKYMGTKDGKLVYSLVREFLEFFQLDFTLSVFEPETGGGEYYEGRSSLAEDLGVTASESQPLLAELIKNGPQEKGRRPATEDHVQPTYYSKDLNTKQVNEARGKFDHYDKDKNGYIDKDELRELFCDVFPGFHKNLLDRYVQDEFRAADTDLSNGIDFTEFMSMYQRLFVQCRSVVSTDVTDIVSPRKRPESPTRIPSPTKKATFSFPNGTSDDNKNAQKKKNPELSKKTEKTTSFGRSNSLEETSKKEDSFFDDPIPSLGDTPRSIGSEKSKDKKDSKPSKPGVGFLAGAPPLSKQDQKGPLDFDLDLKDIEQSLADVEIPLEPIDDYDDDFESSNVSPIGQTPMSARSDHNIRSIEEDLDEDIEEDLSVAEDLLKSDNSGLDDMTTDRTVSPTEQSTAFDYAEEVHLP